MTASKKNPPLTETFTAYLKTRRMRLTSARMAVVSVISGHTGMFTVDDVYSELAGGDISVSLATVYNTVNMLCEASLVNAVGIADSPGAMYKVAGNSPVQILHICEKCGRIKEVSDRNLATYLSGHTYRGFTPRAISLAVHGMCASCSRRRKKY